MPFDSLVLTAALGNDASSQSNVSDHSSNCIAGSCILVMLAGVPGVKPVIVELTDFKTKEKVDELEVDAVLVATGRAPYTQASPVTFHQTHHSQKLVPCHASHG